MITYQVEKLIDIIDELKPLLENHWEEVAWYKDKVKLNPDYDKYLEMDSTSVLHIVTARDEDVLVGYDINFLLPHGHYSDHLYAINDIIFLKPEYRHFGVAQEMVEYAEQELKNLGVSVITFHMKVAHPFHSLMEATGYQTQEYTYSKYIGG